MASDRLISLSFIGIYIGLTTNVGNAYTASLPPVGGYTLNGLYNATFNVANTGVATLDGHNILANGLGLSSGTIVALADNLLRWDGSNFNLMVGSIAGALGPAGGDLSGTYPNPTVSKIRGVTVGSATANAGNLLISTASQWVSTTITGDITLTSGGLATVTSINGVTLGATTASTPGNLLIASGSAWVTQSVSGDITINSSGVASIGANKVTNTQLAQAPALTLKGNSAAGIANVSDIALSTVKTALGLSGTNSGDVTLAAVGSAPNANAASLSTQVLTLQPADGSNPGVLTAGTQNIGGAKTFTASSTTFNGTVVSTNVSNSGFLFVDRTSAQQWQWYATSAITRLFNGTADVFTINNGGEVKAANFGSAGKSDGTFGATGTVNWTQDWFHSLTLTTATNCTLTFTAPAATGNPLYLLVHAPASGTSPTITWPVSVKGTPPTVITLAKASMLQFMWDGTNYYYMGGCLNV